MVTQKYSQTYTSPKTIHFECHGEKGRPFPTQYVIKWWNACLLPYGNQKYEGVQKAIRTVNRKQVSTVAHKHKLPIHLASHHVSQQMPDPQRIIPCWFWFSSPRHLLQATAGAGRGMVPMLFSTILGSCGYAEPSCSCLWNELLHSGKGLPRHLSCALGSRCPLLFRLVVYVPAPVLSQIESGLDVHMGAKNRTASGKPDTTTIPPLWDYWWMFMLIALTVH